LFCFCNSHTYFLCGVVFFFGSYIISFSAFHRKNIISFSICINGSYRVKFIIKQTDFCPWKISEVTKSVTFPYILVRKSF
jgi:hypothetical protein